jgi:predicted nucleic acid-binding protein
MIVVDSNVVAYLYLPCTQTPAAERLLEQDPEWMVPPLWRSEFRNILAGYLRRGSLTLEQAQLIQQEAEAHLSLYEIGVDSALVLQLVKSSPCSAYDCEFVALARTLGVALVTNDQKLLASFPGTARPLPKP